MSDLLDCLDELLRYVTNYEMEYKMASISMNNLMKLMNKNLDNIIIFDTRTSYKNGDWYGGHIKGAINVPSYNFKRRLPTLCDTYKNKQYIIIHCMYSQFRGPRSTQIYLKYLHDNNLRSSEQYIYLLEGGFNKWLNECIKINKMELIEDFDVDLWELINNEYVHIVEHGETWDTINTSANKKPVISAPKFKTFKWGIIDIDFNAKIQTFKDVILAPNMAKSWDWKLDETKHKPGITIKAIEMNKLLQDSQYIILTKGVNNVLQTKNDTIEYLEKAKKNGNIKDYFILQSNNAVEKYTKLIENGHKVSGLFHSTC